MVVRPLASHLCSMGLTPVYPSLQNTNYPNSNLIWKMSPISWGHLQGHRIISSWALKCPNCLQITVCLFGWCCLCWELLVVDPTLYWVGDDKTNNNYYNCERFEPSSHFKSRLSLIVWVNVVLNRTIVVDSDRRFDNLCGSHLQRQLQSVSFCL